LLFSSSDRIRIENLDKQSDSKRSIRSDKLSNESFYVLFSDKIMNCKKGSFGRSDDKSCIPVNWKCDGVKDCSGGSDEDPRLCGNGN
jgi:hypothetical protein